jgi:hypothetical protein
MKNILLLVGILSIASCWGPCNKASQTPLPQAAGTPDLENDVSLQRECAELFKTILSIQDNRESYRDQLHTVRAAFNEDRIGQKKMAIAHQFWLDNENALATQAANLYSEGRTKGCFQKVTQ